MTAHLATAARLLITSAACLAAGVALTLRLVTLDGALGIVRGVG